MSYFDDCESLRDRRLFKDYSRYKTASIENPLLQEAVNKGIYLAHNSSIAIKDMTLDDIKAKIEILERSHTTSSYKARKEYYLPVLKEELQKRLSNDIN